MLLELRPFYPYPHRPSVNLKWNIDQIKVRNLLVCLGLKGLVIYFFIDKNPYHLLPFHLLTQRSVFSSLMFLTSSSLQALFSLPQVCIWKRVSFIQCYKHHSIQTFSRPQWSCPHKELPPLKTIFYEIKAWRCRFFVLFILVLINDS